MKTLIALLKHTGLFSTALLLIASLSWSGTAAAAACESTNYDLNTQHDVDALGATGCDSVVGYMVITEWADITNLDGLANLISVGGDLQINDNDALANCKSVAPLLGWPNGPPYDSVEGVIRITRNGTGCNSIAEVLASYLLPTQARFNALLKSIQAVRGVDTDL